MVQHETDPLTGGRRDDVLMSRHDADRLRLTDGDPVRLASRSGAYTGRARTCEMKPRNLEVPWPEGNVLLCREEIDIASREPDFNAIVSMERA